MDLKNFDWSQFTISFYYPVDVEKLYKQWATSSGLESFFIEKAIFKKNESAIRKRNEFIIEGDYSFIKGQEGVMALLKRDLDFTALFCGNDQSAMSAIATLTSNGFNVPDDISVFGYDDNDIAPFTSPPLSTIRVPFDDMALAAVRYLLNTCYDLQLSVEHNFPVELIERKSVRNLT